VKLGIFYFTADVKNGVTTLRVTDYSRRLVAIGQGASIHEAQEDAIATTNHRRCKRTPPASRFAGSAIRL